MKHTLLIFAAAIVLMAGCNKTTKTDKDMNTLTFNEKQAAAMTAIACYEAQGDQASLATAIHEGFDAGLTANQIKEALSQLYAYTGFPRSLNALGTLQKVMEQRGEVEIGTESTPLPSNYDALKQGTEVQTKLSGQPFDYKFCPAEGDSPSTTSSVPPRTTTSRRTSSATSSPATCSPTLNVSW